MYERQKSTSLRENIPLSGRLGAAIRDSAPVLRGVFLILFGLALLFPAIKPYGSYMFEPASAERPLGNTYSRVFIPSIKLSAPLVEKADQLDYGIGWFDRSRAFGATGNNVLEGHNMSRQSPLFSLLHLAKTDDSVVIHHLGKRFSYRIYQRVITSPKALKQFTRPTKDERLTLVTCYPPTATAMRLVLLARPDSK